jgi:hypothetical protein
MNGGSARTALGSSDLNLQGLEDVCGQFGQR